MNKYDNENEALEFREKEYLHDRQVAFRKSLGGTHPRSEMSERALERMDNTTNPNPLE